MQGLKYNGIDDLVTADVIKTIFLKEGSQKNIFKYVPTPIKPQLIEYEGVCVCVSEPAHKYVTCKDTESATRGAITRFVFACRNVTQFL